MAPRLVPLLVLSLASWAWAGGKEDLEEASRLVSEVHEEEAVQVLTRALDRPDLTAEQRADAYALLGLARLNLHDEEGASLAFRRAFDAKADVELPRAASPKTRSLFDETRAAWTKEQAQKVVVVPPPPPPPIVVQPADRFPLRKTIGIGVGVIGVGLAVTGGVLFFDARGQYAQAQAAGVAHEADRLYRAAVSTNTLGITLACAGLAAIAGGLTILFWPASKAPLTLVVTPTSLGLFARF